MRFKFSGEYILKTIGETIIQSGKRANLEEKKLIPYSVNNISGFVTQEEQWEDASYTKASKDGYKVIYKNEIAYNPARINVGSIGLFKDEKGIISSLYVCFKCKKIILPEYLFNFIKTNKFNRNILKTQEGGVRSYFFFNKLEKSKIYLPNLDEQQKIVDFLRKIDERIETQSKIINTIQSQIFSINHQMIDKSREKVKLCEICSFENKTNRKSSDGLIAGMYPFFTNEEDQTQYLNEYDFDGEYIIANTGGKANFKYFKGKFASMSDCLVIKIINKELTYFYSNILKFKQTYIDYVGFEGSGLKHLNKKWLLNLIVPKYGNDIKKYLIVIKKLTEKLQKEKDILSLHKKQKAYLLQNMFI